MAPEKVGHNKNAKLPMSKMLNYPELNVNPFGDRICKVFSSSRDGDCTFEDFLDMMSVFSENAPKLVKAEHAFRIFGNRMHIFLKQWSQWYVLLDFDGDDMLGISDLQQVIQRLIGGDNHFTNSEIERLVRKILEEADLDDDGALSFAEFEHVINRSADFMK